MCKKYILISIFLILSANIRAQVSKQFTDNKHLKLQYNKKLPILKVEHFYKVSKSIYLLRSTLASNGLSKTLIINNKNYVFQQSIGQKSVIGTFNKNKYIVRQGFLQSPNSFSTSKSFISKKLDAKYYPNPFLQSIEISFNELITNTLTVEIYNLSGAIVYSKKFSASPQITIHTNNLKTGSFILKIKTDNKYLIEKLVKK